MKKVRKVCSALSLKLWYELMVILWISNLIFSSNVYFSYSKHSWAYRWESVKCSYLLGGSSLGLASWVKAGKRLLWLEFLLNSDMPSEELRESIILKAGGSKMSAELLEISTRFLSLVTPVSVLRLWLIWLFLIKNEKNYNSKQSLPVLKMPSIYLSTK